MISINETNSLTITLTNIEQTKKRHLRPIHVT